MRTPLLPVLFGAVALPVFGCDRPDGREETSSGDVPRLAMGPGGPALELPRPMQAALEAYQPAFRPWRLEDYKDEVAARVEAEALALFGVVGDFDGNGYADVALQGRAEDLALFFVILASSDTARIIPLEETPLPRWWTDGGRPEYLRLVRPGELSVPESVIEEISGPPPELDTDAFEVIIEGQAGALYYWSVDRFKVYQTGD